MNLLNKIKAVITGKRLKWRGDYQSWDLAQKQCKLAYSDDSIIQQVTEATRQVENGCSAYERDGVNFDEIQYSWPLTSAITWAAARCQGQLSVIDFGGALGSSYRQNSKFLQGLQSVKWTVVEQEKFVRIGKQEFSTSELFFQESLDEAITGSCPNLILLPSVLQYLEEPLSWLDKIKQTNADVIVIDRTLISLENRNRLTIQYVPPTIYEAMYPCWILSEESLIQKLLPTYKLVEKFPSDFNKKIKINGKNVAQESGYIFVRNANDSE